MGFFRSITFKVKTVVCTFFATFEDIGLLFILPSGHIAYNLDSDSSNSRRRRTSTGGTPIWRNGVAVEEKKSFVRSLGDWNGFSVTRLGNFLDFGQLFKACGSNYFALITNIFSQFLKRCQNLSFF